MKKIKLNFIQLVIIVIVPAIFMSVVTSSLVYKRLNESGKIANKHIREFASTYNKLLDEYYEDLDENKLIDAAINGMLNYTGDNYTIYMNENATEDLNEKLDGTYEGVGISINLNDNNEIYIHEVFEESPAYQAGIQKGDIIISINDIEVMNKSADEVSKIIKDSKETKFKICVKRNEEVLNFEVEKKLLIVPAMSSSIKEVDGKKIGYIYLETFSSTLDTQVETTLLSMEKDGIDSLIMDVRENTGGYLTSCTNIIELFLEKDKLMYTIKGKKTNEKYKDTTDTKREYPIVVLINGGSASASEILAASLKYSYGAIIVGTTSFGKGKVQTTGTLEDGTMIKYTTARWFMPNGKCIDGKGIKPDVEIELDDNYSKNPSEENDNQLNEAIKILTN